MADPVSRLNSALSGRYRIEREVGEGGMATVYLADDLKHERKVALKVLKPELAAVVGAERFLAEIKTTANLQHPHILPLHDSGEADGFLFYVMPYVAGESLRDRLDREHQLPIDDAVRIATNVGEALDYAHSQGVIHRDIKPANILLQAGKPVISDFGIALAVRAGGGGRLTETGLSLGTPHYMSPEQATGDLSVGAATDVYALGCVLYEMLVGEPPYTGSTAQAILGKIIAGEVAKATKQRASVPTHVDAAIRKALEKLPADRFSGAGDFARSLADPGFRWGDRDTAVVSDGRWRAAAVLMGAAAIMFAGLALRALRTDSGDAEWRTYMIQPYLDPDESFGRGTGRYEIALAPDGSGAMAIADDYFGGSIRLKEGDQRDGTFVSGTEGGYAPTFSPDGQSIAFFTEDRQLRRVPRGGGAATTIADAGTTMSMVWVGDGTVLYVAPGGGIARVGENGGESEVVLRREDADGYVYRLMPLPDARGAIYLACSRFCETRSIRVFDMEEGTQHLLVEDAVGAWYAPTGHLVYVRRDGGLLAAPFDLEALEISGPAVPVSQGVRTDDMWAEMQLADDGRVAYMPGLEIGGDRIVEVDRTGNVVRSGEWTSDESTTGLRLSPSGAHLAYSRGPEVWVKELPDGPDVRLSEGIERARDPFWSSDGRVAYQGADSTRFRVRRSDASTSSVVLLERGEPMAQGSWSRDGRWLVYSQGVWTGNSASARDLRYVEFGADTTDNALLANPAYNEWAPELSPDGRWLAYLSDESGVTEVYVRPFPNVNDGRIQISSGHGSMVAWAHSSDEIFYRDSEDRLVAVEIETDAALRVLRRVPLFDLGSGPYRRGPRHRHYAVALDDQSFYLVMTRRADRRLVLVLNFFEELKRLVPN